MKTKHRVYLGIYILPEKGHI